MHNFFTHFKTVNTHRFWVWHYARLAGIGLRGFSMTFQSMAILNFPNQCIILPGHIHLLTNVRKKKVINCGVKPTRLHVG